MISTAFRSVAARLKHQHPIPATEIPGTLCHETRTLRKAPSLDVLIVTDLQSDNSVLQR